MIARSQAPGLFILVSATLLGAMGLASGALAQSDPYRITSSERAACTADAVRLCASSYPDEGRLLACMASNRAALSHSCLVVFDAGVKRRHLAQR